MIARALLALSLALLAAPSLARAALETDVSGFQLRTEDGRSFSVCGEARYSIDLDEKCDGPGFELRCFKNAVGRETWASNRTRKLCGTVNIEAPKGCSSLDPRENVLLYCAVTTGKGTPEPSPTPTPRATASPRPSSSPSPAACPAGTSKRTDSRAPRGYRCDCAAGLRWNDEGSSQWTSGQRCDFGNKVIGAGSCACVAGPSLTPTPTPGPSSTPKPTVTPKPAPTQDPGPCPPGTVPVLTCEPAQTPEPAPTSRPSPAPTVAPGSEWGPFADRISRKVWGGGWPVGPVFTDGARNWFFPETYAIDRGVMLEEWSRHHATPSYDVWWSVREEMRGATTIEEADAALALIERDLDRLDGQRAEAFARGWPECSRSRLHDCAPRKVALYIDEPSSFSWGMWQDLSGGFYETSPAGKRRLRPASEFAPIFWGEARLHFLAGVKRWIHEGRVDGSRSLIVPFIFGWAAQLWAAQHGSIVVAPITEPEMLPALERANPEVWPPGHVWRPNPHSRPGSMLDDPSDPAVAKRDLFYFQMFLARLRVEAPSLVRLVIPQLSNGVLGLHEDDVWARDMAELPSLTRLYGFGSGIQIEGANTRINGALGKPWNAPLADCSMMKLVERDPKARVVIWPGTSLRELDPLFRDCPG